MTYSAAPWIKWGTVAMSSPFDPYWLYEMGKNAAKRPNREVSNGAFVVVVICFIISLVLVGGVIALFVWLFTS